MTANRNHLWIPEGEIDNVEKSPKGRSKEYGLAHSEHGQKLSQGLQDVMDFYRQLLTSDFLDEQDLVTFKVVLQDDEDFAVKKDFVENEGLTINAVKDSSHAVVSASHDVFGNLQGRV
ncbi:MAG: hypothetical protein IKX88_01620, partial [Thermoguttaceae bacterium]|nr:hypothetical protein [Thermoguttaceae bacterium]